MERALDLLDDHLVGSAHKDRHLERVGISRLRLGIIFQGGFTICAVHEDSHLEGVGVWCSWLGIMAHGGFTV